MKYNKKPEIIEAIEFKYSDAGLTQLREFCGKCLLRTGPKRTPTTGPWAYIKLYEGCHEIIIAMEKNMIIKYENGNFSCLEKDKFEQQYDPITE